MKKFLQRTVRWLVLPVLLAAISPPLIYAQYASARQSDAGPSEAATEAPAKALKDILSTLEQSYHVSFNYDDDALHGIYLRENFDWNKTEKLEKVLTRLLTGFHMTFQKIDRSNYLILAKPANDQSQTSSVRLPPVAGNAYDVRVMQPMIMKHAVADVIVSGTVTADDGGVLPGVNVLVKGTTNGTTTDSQGKYSLSLREGQNILVFSFIGYNTTEVAVESQTTIDVTMATDIMTLNEVVVVGYGVQENKDVTGAVGAIKGEKLMTSAVPSVDQALQGRMSGVYVTSNSGEPGGGLSMRVRGIGGLGASEPLYVIDGVIITYNASSSYGYKESANNPLATLNMSDIESISVLKDASASAIYGARAGNGVVIITTKRGKAGAPKLNFESYYGVQKVAKELDVMNASEYAAYSNDARSAAGLATSAKFTNPSSLGKGTDWQNAIFRTAPIQNYQLSLSGGSEKNQYYISAGYMKQDGIIIGSTFDRYSLKLNLDNKVTDWLKISNSLTLSRSYNQSLTNNNGDRYAGIVAQALRRSPTLGIYNDDGSWAGPDASDTPFVGTINNPVMLATLNYEPNERIRALENFNVEVNLHKTLTFRTSLGVDYILNNYKKFSSTFVEGSLSNNKAEARSLKSTQSNLLAENTLTYRNTFGKDHTLEVLAGYTAQLSTSDYVSAMSFFHLTNELKTVDAGQPDPARLAGGGTSQTSYVSLLGRVNYSYKDRYLFTANVRRDGSSVFTSANKYAVFPSFSAGWRISEENFLKGNNLLNDLKLRASWGQVGIDGSLGIGTEYATIASGYKYNFGHTVVNGMMANRVPNSNLKWETVTQTDVGVDLGLFDNRLSFTADYFVKRYEDMITQKPIPIYAGMVSDAYYENSISQAVNSATVENKGLELAINYQNRTQGGFMYSFGANLTTFKNKVVKLDEDIVSGSTGNGAPGFVTRTTKGRSIGEFYGYVTDGIFHSQADVDAANAQAGDGTYYQNAGTAPGDIRFKDLDGDHVIRDADRAYLGSPLPDFSYGFSSTFEYKGFNLDLLFQGVHGNKIMNVNRYILEGSTDGENKGKGMVNRWTETNADSSFPRAISTDPNDNDRASDRYLEDGAYLRLKNIQLGYTLPKSMVAKLRLSNVKVYFSAQNLFTITGYSGYNPDIGSPSQINTSYGIDNTIYPNSITFLGGLNIGL